MKKPVKLKPNDLGMGIFVMVIVIVIIGSRVIFGREAFYNVFWIILAIFALIHFVVLLRTKNWGHLIAMLFYLFIAATFFNLSFHRHHFLTLFFAVSGFILFILFMYVMFTNRIKWRYTEILELAARPVDESDDGFSPRPFPAGEARYAKGEVIGFAKFLLKHVIAYPYFEENRVTLVVPQNMFSHLLFLKRSYQKDTYISFDFNGNVSVHIAKKDYQKYKEELTFDRLCDSFGNLFREFLELYQRSESSKIIDRLNALRFIS